MEVYTNDLHEALLKKNSTVFWQCWRSKFESNTSCKLIKGSVDADVIAGKFACHITSVFSCNDPQKATLPLSNRIMSLRALLSGYSRRIAGGIPTEILNLPGNVAS